MTTSSTSSPTNSPDVGHIVTTALPSMAVVGALVLAYVGRNILQPQLNAAKRSLSMPVETEKSINAMLGRMLSISGASRVLVAQFHNGQNYYSGYSYSKLTVTHEAVDVGIATVSFNLKDVPLSLYAEDLSLVQHKALISNVRYVFITPDSLGNATKSSVSRQRMLRMGVEGYYCFILKATVDHDERDIGAIFVQYNDVDSVRNINDEILTLVDTIESYLVPHMESKNIFIKLLDMAGSLLKST